MQEKYFALHVTCRVSNLSFWQLNQLIVLGYAGYAVASVSAVGPAACTAAVCITGYPGYASRDPLFGVHPSCTKQTF